MITIYKQEKTFYGIKIRQWYVPFMIIFFLKF